MRFRPLFAFLLLVLALGGGAYTLWWFHAADTLRARLAAWEAEERARAGFVEHGPVRVGGFPLRLRAETTDIRLRRADGLTWRGDGLTAAAPPWRPGDVTFVLTGVHHLSLPAAAARPPLTLTAQGGSGQVRIDRQGQLQAARLALDTVRLAPADVPAAPAVTAQRLTASATRPPVPPATHAETGLSLSATAQGLTLPEALVTPLGRTLEALALDLRVLGSPPQALTPQALAAWSEAGGTVEVERLDLQWGPLGAAAEGTLALDADLQPLAALTARLTGYEAALDAFARAGMLAPNQANLAKVALNLLARRPQPEAEPVLTAPVTLQDRWLYVGPVRLLPVPQMIWR